MIYFIDDTNVTVIFNDGSSAHWDSTSDIFEEIKNLCLVEDESALMQIRDQTKMLMNEEVRIEGNLVIIDKDNNTFKITLGDSTDPVIRFIDLLKKKGVIDTEIKRIKPFLRNMFANTYINAVEEIYDFCKAMDFEITDDGCILAYKKVRADLGSVYDNGKTKHEIGKYTEVEVFDTNRENTCSQGLHFCSRNYLDRYSGEKVIIVKVDPRDIVSIPVDYNFEKGRCCRYLVVGILEEGKTLAETDIEKMSEGKVKTIKAEPKSKSKKFYKNRISETAGLMKKYKNDKVKVAKAMGISVSTVERNMRKYKRKK